MTRKDLAMPPMPAAPRLLTAAVLAAILAALVLALAPAPALAANGCGPAGFGFLVPDRPLGFDFHGACDRHDDCYTTPWRDVAPARAEAKLTCDTRFLDDLDASCTTVTRRLELCLELALEYFRAVRSWLGDLAYARAQA
jgi:hypothetical protein